MSVYVYFKRKKEGGIFLPNFEVHNTMPEGEDVDEKRVHSLEDGECIYGGKFYLSCDQSYIECFNYRVSNVGGQVDEEMIESYTLPRYGR